MKGIPIDKLIDHFVYDINSPSKLSTKSGRNVGYLNISKGRRNYTSWKTMYLGKSWHLHRLVWLVCNGPFDESLTINHIDNDSSNNEISNLELCTISENNRRTTLHTERTIRKDNKLQITGVSEMVVNGRTYIVARCRYKRKLYSKVFSVDNLGKELAIELAIKARKEMLTNFNNLGAGFTITN